MNSQTDAVYALGIMSGTSADGIDCAIIQIPPNGKGKISIVASHHQKYPDDLQDRIRKITAKKISDAKQADNLDAELAKLYAQAAQSLIESSGIENIEVIGCHGQTVNHQPNAKNPFSLQLVRGDILARELGRPVVTDFRSADILAGGQGAPLAPGFHRAVFSSTEENRCIVNIGGIANITCLPKDPDADVIGFDTGPGNTLIDTWCREKFDCPFDRDGEIAKSGVIHLDLLQVFLGDPYFAKPPPKSTGLEYFNRSWLKQKLNMWDCQDQCTDADVLTNITALTAKSIADQLNNESLELDCAYLAGGGAKNTILVEMIKFRTDVALRSTEDLGFDPQQVEAAAFAWMAHQTSNGLTSTLPSVTGAAHPTIAGTIDQP